MAINISGGIGMNMDKIKHWLTGIPPKPVIRSVQKKIIQPDQTMAVKDKFVKLGLSGSTLEANAIAEQLAAQTRRYNLAEQPKA